MIALARRPEKLSAVLTPEEAARLIGAAPGAKYRAAIGVAYGAGLRASEVIALKVSDIDGARMVLQIEDAKGPKDRPTKLSPKLFGELRAWYRAASACTSYQRKDGIRSTTTSRKRYLASGRL
jgi:integrase